MLVALIPVRSSIAANTPRSRSTSAAPAPPAIALPTDIAASLRPRPRAADRSITLGSTASASTPKPRRLASASTMPGSSKGVVLPMLASSCIRSRASVALPISVVSRTDRFSNCAPSSSTPLAKRPIAPAAPTDAANPALSAAPATSPALDAMPSTLPISFLRSDRSAPTLNTTALATWISSH